MHNTVVRHWWNGTWGRFARRDVYVRTDGSTFELELREGGSEGRTWKRTYAELSQADDEAARHRDPAMSWTDIAGAHRR